MARAGIKMPSVSIKNVFNDKWQMWT